MNDLIDELASARFGNDTLDRAIQDALRGKPAPAYTTSMDASLALIPYGWKVTSLTDNRKGGGDGWSVVLDGPRHQVVTGTADVPALAMCIAALRAIGGEGM